jgi:hypothetical protein
MTPTRREWFAGMALAHLTQHLNAVENSTITDEDVIKRLASTAVKLADALLEELAKPVEHK